MVSIRSFIALLVIAAGSWGYPLEQVAEEGSTTLLEVTQEASVAEVSESSRSEEKGDEALEEVSEEEVTIEVSSEGKKASVTETMIEKSVPSTVSPIDANIPFEDPSASEAVDQTSGEETSGTAQSSTIGKSSGVRPVMNSWWPLRSGDRKVRFLGPIPTLLQQGRENQMSWVLSLLSQHPQGLEELLRNLQNSDIITNRQILTQINERVLEDLDRIKNFILQHRLLQ